MLYRVNISNVNKCELCAGNNVDNLRNCFFFEHKRDYHLRELQNRLISSGGRSVFDLYVDLSSREKLIFLIDILFVTFVVTVAGTCDNLPINKLF